MQDWHNNTTTIFGIQASASTTASTPAKKTEFLALLEEIGDNDTYKQGNSLSARYYCKGVNKPYLQIILLLL